MPQTTGIIKLKLKPGMPSKTIEDIVTKFFWEHKDVIEGMEFNELDKPETLDAIIKALDEKRG